GIDRVAHLRTAASECAANAKRRLGGIAETLAACAIVLKARFVDHCWPQHCRLCQLQTLKREQRVVSTLRQRKSADATVLGALMIVKIARHQCIALVQLVIETRAEVK